MYGISNQKNPLWTDLSKNSSYAFLYAIDMAKKHDAKIVITHAIEPIPANIMAYLGAQGKRVSEEIKKREQKMDVEEIKKHLQDFCKKAETQIGSPCVELVSKILIPVGHPVDEILKTADEEGCDVIVLGTHGKGFLAHTFLGSGPVQYWIGHENQFSSYRCHLKKSQLTGMESDRSKFTCQREKAGSEMALPFLCRSRLLIVNLRSYLSVKINRWKLQRRLLVPILYFNITSSGYFKTQCPSTPRCVFAVIPSG